MVVRPDHAVQIEGVFVPGKHLDSLVDARESVRVCVSKTFGVDFDELSVGAIEHHWLPLVVVEPVIGSSSVRETIPAVGNHATPRHEPESFLEAAVLDHIHAGSRLGI